jgi:hypothetical protein
MLEKTDLCSETCKIMLSASNKIASRIELSKNVYSEESSLNSPPKYQKIPKNSFSDLTFHFKWCSHLDLTKWQKSNFSKWFNVRAVPLHIIPRSRETILRSIWNQKNVSVHSKKGHESEKCKLFFTFVFKK